MCREDKSCLLANRFRGVLSQEAMLRKSHNVFLSRVFFIVCLINMLNYEPRKYLNLLSVSIGLRLKVDKKDCNFQINTKIDCCVSLSTKYAARFDQDSLLGSLCVF